MLPMDCHGRGEMKTSALRAGISLAAAANAQSLARAPLVGLHADGSSGGAPWLIRDCLGAHAHLEILSQDGQCAPHATVP